MNPVRLELFNDIWSFNGLVKLLLPWRRRLYRYTVYSSDFYGAMLCISAAHAAMRCLSVRHVGFCQTSNRILRLFSPSGGQTILVFAYQTLWRHSDWDPLNGGVECRGGIKILRFSTNISLYLPNDARQSHSYYGRWMENRTQAFEWCHFQWLWVTRNLDFKVRILLDVK